MSAMISIGSQSFLEALYLDHELVNAVMEAYCSWTAKVIRRVCDMGVDVIFMTDDFAFISGPFVSPASFRQWIVPYHKIAIKEISIPWILHSDGYIFPILKDLLALGIKGIHPIGPNCMDIRAFKRTYGDRICVIGNVNINILVLGTQDETFAEVCNLFRDLAPGYGYILSSGNSIPDYVQPENVLALAKAIKDFGTYKN